MAADKQESGQANGQTGAPESGQPASRVTVRKGRNGQYFFTLVHRGVTYPATGPFGNAIQAATAAQAVLKGLDAQAGGRKA